MENIEKGELITTGKAKSLYESNQEDFLIMHYRDDTSAFDGKKIESKDYESEVQKSTDDNISLIEKILLEKEKEILTL